MNRSSEIGGAQMRNGSKVSIVTHALLLGRSEDRVVYGPTRGAGAATSDSRGEHFVARLQNDDPVDGEAESLQHHAERRGLCLGPGKAVEENAGPGGQSGQLLLHHLDDEGIGDELTSGHVPLRLVPQIGAGIRCRTQKIARYDPLPSHRIRE